MSRTSLFVHGSTIATNKLLERTGATVGLYRDAGIPGYHRNSPRLGRQSLGSSQPWPDPVVPRHRRLSVVERIDVEGNPVVPLDPSSVHNALDRLLSFGVESIAVGLLHNYRNPDHEHR